MYLQGPDSNGLLTIGKNDSSKNTVFNFKFSESNISNGMYKNILSTFNENMFKNAFFNKDTTGKYYLSTPGTKITSDAIGPVLFAIDPKTYNTILMYLDFKESKGYAINIVGKKVQNQYIQDLTSSANIPDFSLFQHFKFVKI